MKLHQTLKNEQAQAKADVIRAKKALTQLVEITQKAVAAATQAVENADRHYREVSAALGLAAQTPAPVKTAPKTAPKTQAKAAPVKKIDGRSKEARAAKAAASGSKPAIKKAAPAKKPVTKKASKATVTARQVQGRRDVAEGKRPSLRDAVIKVMGNRVMSKDEVYEALKAKGWLPNSNQPLTYVGYTLSGTKLTDGKHLFERAAKGRGYYQVRADYQTIMQVKAPAAKAPKAEKPARAKPWSKVKAAKAEPAQEAPKTNGSSASTTDEILRDAGLDPAAPFGG